jgi:WD40 repeat protein
MMSHLATMNIKNMDLNKLEDNLIFSTDKNQLFKVKVNLERPSDGAEYDYLVSNFHSGGINGIDLCIRKQILATCGTDKTVKIWSYNDD